MDFLVSFGECELFQKSALCISYAGANRFDTRLSVEYKGSKMTNPQAVTPGGFVI